MKLRLILGIECTARDGNVKRLDYYSILISLTSFNFRYIECTASMLEVSISGDTSLFKDK